MRCSSLLLLAFGVCFTSPALHAQSSCSAPHLVPIPHMNPSPGGRTRLWALDAAGPTDLWAVGTRLEMIQGQSEWFSYVLHGDGETWIEVPAPSPAVAPGFRNCELFAVAAVNPNEVYAAGWKLIAFPNNGHLGPQIFVLRWDGTSWIEIAAPIPYFSYMASASGSRVMEIEVLGPNDIWFFGNWTGDQVSAAQPLALHYDGTNFTRFDTPLPLTRREIVSAKAFSASDIWAIGNPTSSGTSPSPYVMHWDGQSWSQIQLFLSPFYSYQLTAIDGASANDFWILGYESLVPTGAPQGFALHWNGAAFVKYPLRGYPASIAAVSPQEVWALGTTIERWDGATWNLVDALPGLVSAQLNGADHLGTCEVWGVGTQWISANNSVQPLGIRIAGSSGVSARVRPPCSGTVLPSAFLAAAAPVIGNDLLLALDDPAGQTGLVPGATFTWWLLAPRPAFQSPCGTLLPGLGPYGSAAELLIDPTLALTTFGPVPWMEAGSPAWHRARVPLMPQLVGRTVYAQGLFASGNAVVLTSGLDLTIGR